MDSQFTMDVVGNKTEMTNDILKQTRKHFSKLGLMFFLGTLLINIVQIIAVGIAGVIKPELLEDMASTLLITMLPMYIIAIPLMALMIHRVPAQQIEKKKMSFGHWILSFLICYGGVYISNYVGILLTQLIGVIKGSPVSNTIVDIASTSSIGVNFLVMVICAPIAEEFLFRKLLIDRTIKYGDRVAILFSGLMFGLFHGNLNQFAYAFVLGICYGFIYVKTGNIRYTIYLHMLNNFLGSVLGMLVLNFVGEEFASALNDPTTLLPYIMNHMGSVIVYFLYALILLGIALAGIILFCVNYKTIKAQLLPGELTIPKGKRFTTTVLNIGMGLFFLFWILVIIVQAFS